MLPGNPFDAASRWDRSWAALGLAAPAPAVRDQVIAAYRAADRAYHSLQHLEECFERLDEAGELPAAGGTSGGEVAVALWFHDAVYDTRRSDNEQASAAWASQVLRVAGAAPDTARRIERLILATRHDLPPETPAAALLVDIDLAILGADPARYDEYERQIREEYAWVPAPDFRSGREAVLTRFLSRPFIYSTAPFRARFEAPARRNLERALAALASAA